MGFFPQQNERQSSLQIISISEMQASKNQAWKYRQAANNQKSIAEGIVNFVLDEADITLKKLQNDQSKSHPKSDRQLLVDRYQGISAAGMIAAQVGDGDRIHRGKLDGVEKTEKENDRQMPINRHVKCR